MYLDAHFLAVFADVADLIGMNLPVFERDSLGYLGHIGLCQRLVESHLIDFLLIVARVRQLAGQLAVIGDEQHAHAVFVEPSDRIDPLGDSTSQQIHDGLVGMRVVERGDEALGFVHHDIDFFLPFDDRPVETHLVVRIDFRSQFGHDLSVDSHQTGRNQVVGLAARTDTRVGDKTVQTNRPRRLRSVESRVAARPAVTMRMSCSLLFRSVALVATRIAVSVPGRIPRRLSRFHDFAAVCGRPPCGKERESASDGLRPPFGRSSRSYRL